MIRHFNDEINLISKSRTGNIDLRRPLTNKEKQWILNERAMCSISCEYYLTRYYMIASESETGASNIMHFTFRSGQRVFWKILQKLDTPRPNLPEGSSKEIFCLKARKQGISTLVEGIISWMATFIPGTKAAIASADGQKSQIMAGMFFFAIDELPWWLESTRTRDKRASDRGIIEWSHIGNQVILQSGSMRGGIGQGTTPNAVHISEASQFTNAVQQLDEGLLKAVTSNPGTFMVLETTGDGDDWTAKMWNHCKENYYKGRARLLPLFLPWFMSPELYPSKSWIAKYPVPKGWEPISETKAMATKCRAYVASTEILRDELGKGWELSIEAQWWWEFNFIDHKSRGIEKSFTRQHPCVVGSTLISTEQGIIPIARASTARQCESGEITAWLPRGMKPTYTLQTKRGRTLTGTKDHLVRLQNGTWKEMGDLSAGEALKMSSPMFAKEYYVHTWNETPIYACSRVIDEDMGRFLGYFMGDGSYHSNGLEFSCDIKDQDSVEDIKRLIKNISGKPASTSQAGNMTKVRSSYIYWMPFLRSIGALSGIIHTDGHKDGYRRKVNVPDCIFRSPKSVIAEFLKALFDCDAHACKSAPNIKLCSAYDDFLRQVQLLLAGFDINSTFHKKRKIAGASIKRATKHEYTSRELSIPTYWVNDFYNKIGFVSARKQNGGKRYTKHILGRPIDVLFIDEVLSVTATGIEEEVFDIAVEGSHLFSANGIEVHNCDDFEALIGEHDKAIGEEALENMTRTVTNEVAGIYMIAGDGIETKHEPKRELVIHGDDALRLYSEWKDHKENKYEWGFIPVEGLVADVAWNPLKKAIIFEEPKPGYIYGIGVDTGTGVELDRSDICVTRKGMDDDEPDVQVAEFTDDTIGQTDLWAWIAAITALYSRYYDPNALPNARHPKLCIELRRKIGDMSFNQLYHSLNFKNHNWFVPLDKTTYKPKPGNAGRPGFFTNAWSRPLLLGFYTSAVENGWYEVKSRFLQEEMKNAEIKVMASGKSRMDHSSTKHDDRVFGSAMSYWTLHDTESLAEFSKRKYNSPAARALTVDYSSASTMVQNCNENWLRAATMSRNGY